MTKMFRINTINGKYYIQEGHSVAPPPGETGTWIMYKNGNWMIIPATGWFNSEQFAIDDILKQLESTFKDRKIELFKARILKQGQN